jgi:hypothetical protein
VDSQARLIIGDDFGVASYSGGSLSRLVLLTGLKVDVVGVDSNDLIFATVTDNTVKKFSPSGVLLDDDFVTGRYLRFAFGPGGEFGTDLYGVDMLSGELVRVNNAGNVAVIGSGFSNSFVTFGTDGALYISEFEKDRILRVDTVPEPSTLTTWALCLFLLSLLGLFRGNAIGIPGHFVPRS